MKLRWYTFLLAATVIFTVAVFAESTALVLLSILSFVIGLIYGLLVALGKISDIVQKNSRKTETEESRPAAFPVSTEAAATHPEFVFIARPKLSYRWTVEDHQTAQGLKDYCVIDVETTGLDCRSDRIVEIAIIAVRDGIVQETFHTFVNPEIPISPAASAVNGIRDADVCDAPKYAEIAGKVYALLHESTVVGHNVTFDLNFAQMLMLADPEPWEDLALDYIDTEHYARQILRGLENYKLQTLLQHYEIDPGQAHSALDDARATLSLFQRLQQEGRALQARTKKVQTAYREKGSALPTTPTVTHISTSSPLFGKSVVFTGDLSIPRPAAAQMAINAGAAVRSSVSRKTDYLVVGEQDPDIVGADGLSAKQRKAQLLNDQGEASIQIIDEAKFLQLAQNAGDEAWPN